VLRGPVLQSEATELLKAAENVRAVRDVVSEPKNTRIPANVLARTAASDAQDCGPTSCKHSGRQQPVCL
jgi:hypothetical protein